MSQLILLTTPTPISGSFIKPEGVTKIIVECWGAGGNGGNGENSGIAGGCGGTGGGGGGYAKATLFYSSSEQIIKYRVGQASGSQEASWWDDVGGPATQIGPYASPTTYYYKVRGAGGASRNIPISCFENGGEGGGNNTGAEYNPNVGDVIYSGGGGAKSGASEGGGGGGGAGSTGEGNYPSGGTGFSGRASGSATTEFGGNGGVGGLSTTIDATSGLNYGGGGGGAKRGSSSPIGYGAQGLIRLTLFSAPYIPKIEWNGNTLNIPYQLDNVVSYAATSDASQFVRIENGDEYAWVPNINYILEGDVRWIPTTSTATQTGWDGATGWRAFLEYARAKNKFKFYIDGLDTSYIESYLVDPLNGEHELEPDGTRKIRLVIRNSTTPYDGY
jgi:hypothetical protein